jgi:hypothetical protein
MLLGDPCAHQWEIFTIVPPTNTYPGCSTDGVSNHFSCFIYVLVEIKKTIFEKSQAIGMLITMGYQNS